MLDLGAVSSLRKIYVTHTGLPPVSDWGDSIRRCDGDPEILILLNLGRFWGIYLGMADICSKRGDSELCAGRALVGHGADAPVNSNSLKRKRGSVVMSYREILAAGGGCWRGPGLVPADAAARQLPDRVWVIVRLHWEFDDEQTWAVEKPVGNRAFVDEAAARLECQRLCQTADAEEAAREVPTADGFAGSPPLTTNWDLLRRACRPARYSVVEVDSAVHGAPPLSTFRWPSSRR